MKVFGIVANLTKGETLDLTLSIIKWFEERSIRVLIPEIAGLKLNRRDLGCSQKKLYSDVDLLIVLGGDGTILGVAREVAPYNTPIFGINMGHLGFITEVEKEDTFVSLERIINDNYEIEERNLLEARVIGEDIESESFYALNEAKISGGTLSKMIKMNTFVDELLLDTCLADGLLISTPTGSTAYSLSAGGPIISPELSVFLINPLCPHTLYSRPIVVSDSKIITVEISDSKDEAFLICDGQQSKKINNSNKIVIKRASFKVKFIKLLNRSFFDVLRSKLNYKSI